MDIFCSRFPDVAESIFDKLNNDSLVNCKEVSTEWNSFLDDPKFLLMRKIVKILKSKNQLDLIPKIAKIITKISTDTFKELEMAVTEFYADESIAKLSSGYSSKYGKGLTLIHILAGTGNTELLKTLLEKNEDLMCKDLNDHVPLHYCAKNGHLEACQYIIGKMENIDDKNPKGITTPLHLAATEGHLAICLAILNQLEDTHPLNIFGETPLHSAAKGGHLQIYISLMDQVEDKNPKDEDNDTPLHIAALMGHIQICELILNWYVSNNALEKNPSNRCGVTPLHLAAEKGYLHVYKVIVDHVIDKNPRDNDGITPLHYAAKEGNFDLCKAIMDHVGEKSPKDNHGWTPLDYAASRDYGEICELIKARQQEDDNKMMVLSGCTDSAQPKNPKYLLLKSSNKCWNKELD